MRPISALAIALALAALAGSEASPARAGEPAAPRVLAPSEYRDLSWEVAPAMKFVDKVDLPLVGQVVSLEAPKGTKIAIVSATLHVPAPFVGTRDLPIEPGRFLARRGGAVFGARAAGLEVGSGSAGVLWLVANTNQEFNVHLSEATKKLQIVIGVPKEWPEFEVLFASPIGSASGTPPHVEPKPPTAK